MHDYGRFKYVLFANKCVFTDQDLRMFDLKGNKCG